MTKFDGYAQYPRPRSDPFFNTIRREYKTKNISKPLSYLSMEPVVKKKPVVLDWSGPNTRTGKDFMTTFRAERDEIWERNKPPPTPPPERMITKGKLRATVPSLADQYFKDQELLKKTLPSKFEREKRYLDLDRQILERRREKNILLDRQMQAKKERHVAS